MSLKQTPIWKFPFLKPAATDPIKVSVPNQKICTQLDMMITRSDQSFRQPPTPEFKRTLLDISERTDMNVILVTDEVLYTGLIEMQELPELDEWGGAVVWKLHSKLDNQNKLFSHFERILMKFITPNSAYF